MAKHKIIDGGWAGTEASLQVCLEMEARGAEMKAGDVNEGGEEDTPYLLDVQGSIGVINIAGPMTNQDSFWTRLMGAASYSAIQEALVAAAEHPDVTDIVLNINSGGGPVNGLSDTGALVTLINDNIKPVVAYTDGKMCSAAYWLGCSAGGVFASSVSEVGSIGIIATHMDYSEQLKADGVKATVMRAGKYKALANSVEPLTEEAKAQIQASLDEAYKVFVQHVAGARNQPYDYVDQNMAQGREFFGAQALAAGLVDGITSFGTLMSGLEKKALDNASHYSQTSRNSSYGASQMAKKNLTQQEIAALASGVAVHASADADAVALAAEAAATEAATLAAAAEAADTPEDGAAAAGEVTKIQEKTESSVVAFLQSQIKDKDAEILQANITLAGLQTKVADQEANFEGLIAIASTSLSNMQVALGGSAIADGLTAVAVLAEHKRVSDLFQTKFKAGGVAAVAAAEEGSASVEQSPELKALIASFGAPTAKKVK